MRQVVRRVKMNSATKICKYDAKRPLKLEGVFCLLCSEMCVGCVHRKTTLLTTVIFALMQLIFRGQSS